MSGASTLQSFGFYFVLKIDKRKKNLLLRRTTTWVWSTILCGGRTTKWILDTFKCTIRYVVQLLLYITPNRGYISSIDQRYQHVDKRIVLISPIIEFIAEVKICSEFTILMDQLWVCGGVCDVFVVGDVAIIISFVFLFAFFPCIPFLYLHFFFRFALFFLDLLLFLFWNYSFFEWNYSFF